MSGTDYELTPNLGLYKPIVDADLDMWGDHLNLNADILDTVVQSNTDALAGYLPLAGNATITGPVTTTGVFTFGGTSGTQPSLIGAGNGGISYLSLGSIGQNIAFGVSAGSIYLFQNGVNVGGALATQTWANGAFLPLSGGQLSGPLISWTGTGPTSPGVGIGDNSTGFWRSAPYLFLSVGGAINQEWTGTQSQMSVPLILAGDATAPLGAVTLRQLEAAGGGGGASVSVGDVPPVSPSQGDLWFDSTDTQLYIQYQDSTSNQWVVANNQSGFVNEAPNDGQIFGRQDSQWVPVPGGGGVPIVFSLPGQPAADALLNVAIAIGLTVAANLAGSVAYASTNATAGATFTVNRLSGGATTPLGTVVMQPTGAATFAGAGGALAAGDVVQLVAPATQDATLADLSISLLATRA